MILRHFILSPEELQKLSLFMSVINGRPARAATKTVAAVDAIDPVNARLRVAFNNSLDVFLNAEGVGKDVFGKNPGRFLKRHDVEGADTKSVVFLYDFVTTIFRNHLRNEYFVRDGAETEVADLTRVLELIDTLVSLRQAEMARLPNPMAALISNSHVIEHGEGLPDTIFDTYVGYRRSSRTGDIIRFVIRLHRTGLSRTFQFENKYRRSDDEWFVDGMGYVAQGTVYLVGHCTNHHDVSRGLRMMALRRDPLTERLFGLLVSMDQQDPICARIFLIPAQDHRIDVDKADFDALAGHVLVRERDMDYEQMITTIRAELPSDLDSNDSELFRYICNANFSVLKCNPEKDGELIDLELRFRNAFVEKSGFNLDVMRKSYVKVLEQAISGYESG